MAAAAVFGSEGIATTSSLVATIAGLSFGTASSDRIIVASIGLQDSSAITGVTIGGITASLIVAQNLTNVRPELWMAEVPTGTSGDVVVTIDTGAATISAATHIVTGADPTWTDTDSATGVAVDISITALTIPSDGVGIVCTVNAGDPTATTWTGASETHDVDVGVCMHSSAIVTTVGTNTITADGATATQGLVGVAFGPAAGGGAIEGAAAQTIAAFTQSAPSKLRIKGAAAQTFAAFTQSAASDLRLRGAASQTLAAMTNASASKLRIKGTA